MPRTALATAVALAAAAVAPARAGTIEGGGVAFEVPAGFEDGGVEAAAAGPARVLRGPDGARLQIFAMQGPRLSARQLRGAEGTTPTPQGCVAVEAAPRAAASAACPGCVEQRAIVVCEGVGAEVRAAAADAAVARAAAQGVVRTVRRAGAALAEAAPESPPAPAAAAAPGPAPAASQAAPTVAAAATPAPPPAAAPALPWLPDAEGMGQVAAPLELPYDLRWGEGPAEVKAHLQGLLEPAGEAEAAPGQLVQRWTGELVDDLGCDRVEAAFADGKLWALRAIWPAAPGRAASLRWEELIQRAAARHGRPAGFTSAVEVLDALDRRGQPTGTGRDRHARLDALLRAGGLGLAPGELLTRWHFREGGTLVVALGVLPAAAGQPAAPAASWLWLAPR